MPKAGSAGNSWPLVAVLVYDGLCTFEYGIAVEAFALPRPEFDQWYRFQSVAVEQGELTAAGGLSGGADAGLEALGGAELVIVPGWRGADEPVPEPLIHALREAHGRGARLASFCSGVFVLAATGLLNGKRATTHWRYAEALQSRYPEIAVDADGLFIDDGQILTAAGSAAGLDLSLHIIRRDFGAEKAASVARRLVLPAHRDGGQKQFVPRPEPRSRGVAVAALMDCIRTRLNEEWTVARMATEAATSERTLARRMQASTGMSPTAWLIAERVAQAVHLIETTGNGLEDIADAAGFGSLETMRHHFRTLRGQPPSWYRTHFGG